MHDGACDIFEALAHPARILHPAALDRLALSVDDSLSTVRPEQIGVRSVRRHTKPGHALQSASSPSEADQASLGKSAAGQATADQATADQWAAGHWSPATTTGMNDPAALNKLDDAIPLGRMVGTSKIVDMVVFPTSGKSASMTATTAVNDGGIMQESVGL